MLIFETMHFDDSITMLTTNNASPIDHDVAASWLCTTLNFSVYLSFLFRCTPLNSNF